MLEKPKTHAEYFSEVGLQSPACRIDIERLGYRGGYCTVPELNLEQPRDSNIP